MKREVLIAKKALYEAKKAEIATETYEAEISAELEAYKAQLVKKYEDIRKADEAKVNNYLELLDELLSEVDDVETTQTIE